VTPEKVLLDTDVVIELLKKTPSFVQKFLELMELKSKVIISPIVVAEIYAGAFKREYKDIEALFSLCELTDVNTECARVAGIYANDFGKAFQGISLEDYFLAASARLLSCPLWTLNRKHFPMNDIVLFQA
jgi:predicted nucleic acid-binding protein